MTLAYVYTSSLAEATPVGAAVLVCGAVDGE